MLEPEISSKNFNHHSNEVLEKIRDSLESLNFKVEKRKKKKEKTEYLCHLEEMGNLQNHLL